MKQYLFTGITILALTACGKSGGGADTPAQSPSNPAAPVIAPTQPGGPTAIPLAYSTLVKTATVSQGGHSYSITMIGHCIVYLSQDYCWDDGWQTVAAIGYETDFWQLCDLNGVVGQCSGGGSSDPVTMPHLWSAMAAYLPLPPYQPADVYTQGISTQVSCTVTGSIVDCVDFQIDTANASL